MAAFMLICQQSVVALNVASPILRRTVLHGAFAASAGNILLTTKAELRSLLIQEVLRSEDFTLAQKLGELRALLPACVERNVACQELIASHVAKEGRVEASTLESNPPHGHGFTSMSVTETNTVMLQTAITFFPGISSSSSLPLGFQRIPCPRRASE